MMFGFSTGTINDKVAAAIERHVPSPSARLKALHWLQDKGFRTYGMLCPILPQKDAAAYKACAQEAMQAIRADRCEEIWAEAVNFRAGTKEPTQDPDDQHQRDSFEATHRALLNGGFKDEAALFRNVAEDPTAWEQYTRSLFEALVEAAPQQKDPRLIVGEKAKAPKPKKLWWLQYPRNYESISGYWEKQEINGALLLGGVLTRYRNPKEAANAKQSSAGVVVAAVAPQSLNRRITRLPIRKGEDLLADETLKEPGEVLRGILYGGTKGVLAAPTKLGKSWVLLDLADSVVTGTPWLQWETVKGRVLYVDYELTQALFKKRLRSAQAAKVEKLGNLDFSNLDTVNLKGVKITFEEVVEDLLSKPKEEWYSLVMIDPLYKAIGAGRESIASVVDQFGSLLDKLAKQTGTAVLLAHHFSKSSRSTMPLLERIGNSSVIAKDSDAIIGLDEHPEENCYTVEMKLRYFAPQPKIVIEGGLGVFKLRPDLDAALTGPEESKKEDRSIALLDLLGSDGLRTNEWKKQAVARHVASPATFGRDKKKLIAAKQVCKDEKSKRWQKCAQPSGPAPS